MVAGLKDSQFPSNDRSDDIDSNYWEQVLDMIDVLVMHRHSWGHGAMSSPAQTTLDPVRISPKPIHLISESHLIPAAFVTSQRKSDHGPAVWCGYRMYGVLQSRLRLQCYLWRKRSFGRVRQLR